MQHNLILGAASVALVGVGAFAMPQEPKVQGDKPVQRTEQPASATKSKTTCHKASEVIGTKVTNSENTAVGKIEDLVLDPTSGRIDYAILSMDANAQKDQWFAVPFSALAARTTDGERTDSKKMARSEFMLNVDSAKLESAPGFPKDKWPDVTASAWRTDLDKHYGTKRMHDSMPSDGGKRMDDTLTGVDGKMHVRAIRASKLLDQNLVTTSGEKIGDIEELAIDGKNARVSFVLVSSGGFLGMGDKTHAIPWAAVRATPGTGKDAEENLVVDVTKERLQKSPEFKKEEWARMSEPTWQNELHQYYGVTANGSGKDTSGVRAKSGLPLNEKDSDRKDANDPR